MLETLTALSGPDPAGLMPARQQMALSLGWHIILACFGVALPTIIGIAHWRGIYRGDQDALILAKRWAKVSAVLFAIGAVSGTVLSFEMGLLWPGLMGTFGDVLGLPFAFEGISFFTEAIFLGIYLYGWGRIPAKRHLLMLVPMGVAGVFGTFCVLAVNAWMNAPVGFDLVYQADGSYEVTNVDPWAVMVNPQVWLQFAHMWVAAFMVAGFSVAAVYAAGLLKGGNDRRHRLGFTIGFAVASVMAVIQPMVGHVLGLRVAENQPAKLAAFELALETEQPAPLRIGGILVDGRVVGAIDIPKLGSLISRNSFSKSVPGLEEFPAADRPPVNITHLAFQSMIGIGSALMILAIGYWLLRWRGTDLADPSTRGHRWFLRGVVLTGPLAAAAVELGWIATEVGRQPWVVYGIMRTPEAAGDNPGLWWLLAFSLLLYGAMTIAAISVLRSMARRWRAGEEDLPSPYSPQSGAHTAGLQS